jgi:hypothetical protein
MGERGPVPKRRGEAHGHRPDLTEKAPSGTPDGEKLGPEPPEWLDGFAREWYESLRVSGQAAFYEPSDWATAVFVARNMMAEVRKPSAVLMAAILHGCTMLAVTEGDRRRIRIELGRQNEGEDPDRAAGVAVMDDWRKSLAPGSP